MSKLEGISAEGCTPAAVGGRGRTAIRGSGMAQRAVAGRIGLNESQLSKSLAGTRRFTSDELLALATATGVTVGWLLSGDTAAGSGEAAVPPPGTLPALHHETEEHALSRRTIIEQAWWLFAEHGYDGVRISDIARAASVSSASVHYYFPSKKDIFAEALHFSVKLAFDRQSAQLPTRSGPAADPVHRLKTLARLQAPVDRQRRAEWSIWLQTWSAVAVGGDRFDHSDSYRRWWETVRGIIARGREAGAFSSASFAPEDRERAADRAADDLTAYIDGLGIRVLTGMISPEEMTARIDDYIDRNLVPTPNPPPPTDPLPPTDPVPTASPVSSKDLP